MLASPSRSERLRDRGQRRTIREVRSPNVIIFSAASKRSNGSHSKKNSNQISRNIKELLLLERCPLNATIRTSSLSWNHVARRSLLTCNQGHSKESLISQIQGRLLPSLQYTRSQRRRQLPREMPINHRYSCTERERAFEWVMGEYDESNN